MIGSKETALRVAEYLLQIKAIKLNPNEPFVWTSGWQSPIYCDNRLALAYPAIRTFIRQELSKAAEEHFTKADVVAGVATAGIPQGALVAQQLDLPFAYVRAEAKKHGMGNQIEGEINPGQKVILIEDLVSTAKSSIAAIKALKAHGAEVVGIISIFTYGFEVAEKAFENEKCKFVSLCNYESLIEKAIELNYVDKSTLPVLESWNKSPETWKA